VRVDISDLAIRRKVNEFHLRVLNLHSLLLDLNIFFELRVSFIELLHCLLIEVFNLKFSRISLVLIKQVNKLMHKMAVILGLAENLQLVVLVLPEIDFLLEIVMVFVFEDMSRIEHVSEIRQDECFKDYLILPISRLKD